MIPKDTRRKIKARYKRVGSYRAVGKQFDVSAITVKRIVLDLRVKHKQKMGRKKITTNSEESAIKKTAKKIAKSGEKVTAKRVRDESGLAQVSLKTIARRLTSMTFGSPKARQISNQASQPVDAVET